MSYEVLEVVQSESNPNKTYEIRKSHRDGKTYCTCPGWIFKARKGDGKCKHIIAYIKEGFNVVVMSIEDFLEIKRAKPMLGDTTVGDVDVKRRKL